MGVKTGAMKHTEVPLPQAQANTQLSLEHVITIARGVRTTLLRLNDETPRNLAGACGLAAMLVAKALNNPYTLRTGFYMKSETFFGKRGRLPYRHAWSRIGMMIVDTTATQFNQNHRAVHVAHCNEDLRYLEIASAREALDDILINWRGRELPAFVQLAKYLRQRLKTP